MYNIFMIDDHWKILIKAVVRKYLEDDYKLFVFGSRATGDFRPTSDMDIGILGNKPADGWKMALIRDELDKSKIPYKTDVVDLFKTSPNFNKIALKKVVYL